MTSTLMCAGFDTGDTGVSGRVLQRARQFAYLLGTVGDKERRRSQNHHLMWTHMMECTYLQLIVCVC